MTYKEFEKHKLEYTSALPITAEIRKQLRELYEVEAPSLSYEQFKIKPEPKYILILRRLKALLTPNPR